MRTFGLDAKTLLLAASNSASVQAVISFFIFASFWDFCANLLHFDQNVIESQRSEGGGGDEKIPARV
jgi:hypothetical protein